MLSAILSFFGGSAFRVIWGEVSAFITKRQEQQYELERMRLQSDIDDKTHSRELENMRLQNELGFKVMEVQRDAAVTASDVNAFNEAVRGSFAPTGVMWVDAWNASVRPQFAEVALILWVVKVLTQNFVMDAFDISLLASIVGFFFADRALARRGK